MVTFSSVGGGWLGVSFVGALHEVVVRARVVASRACCRGRRAFMVGEGARVRVRTRVVGVVLVVSGAGRWAWLVSVACLGARRSGWWVLARGVVGGLGSGVAGCQWALRCGGWVGCVVGARVSGGCVEVSWWFRECRVVGVGGGWLGCWCCSFRALGLLVVVGGLLCRRMMA